MLCHRCGAELYPGMSSCPECGSAACGNACRTASITVSGREARQGAFKTLNMPQLSAPLRFRVKPGTKNGTQIMVNNAVFANPDGGTMLIPVRVTVHVRRCPAALVLPLLLLLLCASFVLGGWKIAEALMDDGEPQTQIQYQPTQPNLPVLPAQTEPVQIPQTLPPVVLQPEPTSAEPVQTEPAPIQPGNEADSPIPHYEIRPLLHQLDEDLMTNLEAIYQAAMNFEPWVDIPCEMTAQELNYLTSLMHTEFPELMQLDNTVSTSYHYDQTTGYVTSYELPFVMTQDEYEQQYQECMGVIDRIVADTQGMSVWEKERYAFDYITDTCTYDKVMAQTNNPYGTLINRRAKCDGISLAMKWIMEEMGITCMCITGDPTVTELGHAWNLVQLDGAYYNVDVTMDVRQDGDECPRLYCALNVADEIVIQSYILSPVYRELLTLPTVTTMEKSYHVLNGSYVEACSDWRSMAIEFFMDSYETGEGQLMQFESRTDYETCLAQINDCVNEAAYQAGLGGYSRPGWHNDEFCVIYFVVERS